MPQINEIDAIRQLRRSLLNVLDSAQKYSSDEDQALQKDIDAAYDALLATASIDSPKNRRSSASLPTDNAGRHASEKPVAWRTYRSGRWCFAYDPSRNFETRSAWEPLYSAVVRGTPEVIRAAD